MKDKLNDNYFPDGLLDPDKPPMSGNQVIHPELQGLEQLTVEEIEMCLRIQHDLTTLDSEVAANRKTLNYYSDKLDKIRTPSKDAISAYNAMVNKARKTTQLQNNITEQWNNECSNKYYSEFDYHQADWVSPEDLYKTTTK
ncbi:hypothetical protein [Vibrio sp. 10N.239.312.D08]|uniref:hypothetical protein n=1 Tax=Vibrio sp. 10N.239.312.D08 TaxID=3229978 RepID=UPI00355069AD